MSALSLTLPPSRIILPVGHGGTVPASNSLEGTATLLCLDRGGGPKPKRCGGGGGVFPRLLEGSAKLQYFFNSMSGQLPLQLDLGADHTTSQVRSVPLHSSLASAEDKILHDNLIFPLILKVTHAL